MKDYLVKMEFSCVVQAENEDDAKLQALERHDFSSVEFEVEIVNVSDIFVSNKEAA